MTCEQVEFELRAYLDGELGWLSKHRLERHLAGCDACRAERDALAAVSAELRGNESFELPETLRTRLGALAPEPVATIPRRRMPTLAWGAVGGACLATLAAIYLKPGGAPTTAREAAPSFASAPSAPKIESKVAIAESSENRAATSMAKPAPAFDAVAPREADIRSVSKSSFDKEPARKSRGRGGLTMQSEVEFAAVSVAAQLSDDELMAAAKSEGGKVVSEKPLLLEIAPENLDAFRKRVNGRSEKPLLLEIAPENLDAFRKRVNGRAPERERANRAGRTVRVRLRTSVSVRP